MNNLYEARTITDLNSAFVEIIEKRVELHDEEQLSDDALIESIYTAIKERAIVKNAILGGKING